MNTTNTENNSALAKLQARLSAIKLEQTADATHCSFKELMGLQALSRRLSHRHHLLRAGLSFGLNDAARLGQGMVYAETRPWVAGDDARHIDWRVTARTGHTHSKIFDSERGQTWMFIIDMRSNMAFGSAVRFKSVQAARVAVTLSWCAFHLGNRIGGVVVTDTGTQVLPARGGIRGVFKLAQDLCKHSKALLDKPLPGSNTARIFDSHSLISLLRILPADATVFVVSDFINWHSDAFHSLKQLSRRCNLLAVRVRDKLEMQAPGAGKYPVQQTRRLTNIIINNEQDQDTWLKCVQYSAKIIDDRMIKISQRYATLMCHEDIIPALTHLIFGKIIGDRNINERDIKNEP